MDSICVQFKTDNTLYIGTLAEIEWRHTRENELNDLLVEHSLGVVDGSQASGGILELFLKVLDVTRLVNWLNNI